MPPICDRTSHSGGAARRGIPLQSFAQDPRQMALRRQSRAPRTVPARASGPLACFPDLLYRPTARPLGCSKLVAVWRRVLWGAQLNEVEDLKVLCAQETDPIAVAEVELHRLIV